MVNYSSIFQSFLILSIFVFVFISSSCDPSDDEVCNSHGVCVSNECDCMFDYYTEDCAIQRSVYWRLANGPDGYHDLPVSFCSQLDVYEAGCYPGNRQNHAMASMGEEIYVFGGINNAKDVYNDLWVFHAKQALWKQISSFTSPFSNGTYDIIGETGWPSSRERSQIIKWVEDSSLLLFGGQRKFPSQTKVSNEVWIYDIEASTFTWDYGSNMLESGPVNPVLHSHSYSSSNNPGARTGHTVTRMEDEKCCIFGGSITDLVMSSTNSMFLYNGNNFKWESGDSSGFGNYSIKGVFAEGLVPGARSFHSSAYSHPYFFVFGGWIQDGSSDGTLNDLWIYDTQKKLWKFAAGDSQQPGNFVCNPYESNEFSIHNQPLGTMDSGSRLVVFKNEILLFGGIKFNNMITGLLSIFSLDLGEWKFFDVQDLGSRNANIESSHYHPENRPGSITQHAVVNVEDSILLVYGGYGMTTQSEMNGGLNAVWYFGSDYWANCFGYEKDDDFVCFGHGECVEDDICVCQEGWQISVSLDCSPKCYGKNLTDLTICSGRGECISPNNCSCEENYFGDECETTTCFGDESSSPSVCNGNGFCSEYDVCNCEWDFYGDRCEFSSYKAWKRLEIKYNETSSLMDGLFLPPLYNLPPLKGKYQNPGGRIHHSGVVLDPKYFSSYDASVDYYGKEEYISFGGSSGHQLKYRNDLWIFNFEQLTWKFLGGGTHEGDDGVYSGHLNPGIPRSRGGASITQVAISGTGQQGITHLVIFGGYAGTIPVNDLWVFKCNDFNDYQDNTFYWMAGEPYSIHYESRAHQYQYHFSNDPGARVHHTANYDSVNDRIIIFGGGNSADHHTTDSIFSYNAPRNQYSWEFGDGNPQYSFTDKGIYSDSSRPGGRKGHTSYYLEESEELFVFGGYTSTGNEFFTMNNLWSYSFQSKNWRYISGYGVNETAQILHGSERDTYHPLNIPTGRTNSGGGLVRMRNEFLVFGGNYQDSVTQVVSQLNDLWFFNYEKMEWKVKSLSPNVFNEPAIIYQPNPDENKYSNENHPGGTTGHVFLRRNEEQVFVHGGLGRSNIAGGGVNYGLLSTIWVFGQDYPANCFGTEKTNNDDDDEVCFGHGECIEDNVCMCQDGYHDTEYCLNSALTCFNIEFYNPEVCFGNGDCVSFNNCSCDNNYYGSICQNFDCFGHPKYYTSKVCTNHGTCIDHDNCTCYEDYFGDRCNEFNCYGVLMSDSDLVCSGGHGSCVDHDECICKNDSSTNEQLYEGLECEINVCWGIEDGTNLVCSQHGDCQGPNVCLCNEDYYAKDCLELIRDPFYIYDEDDNSRTIQFSYYLQTDRFPQETIEVLLGEKFNCSMVVGNWDDYFYLNTSYCFFSFVEILGFQISELFHISLYDPEIENEDDIKRFVDKNIGTGTNYWDLVVKPITSPEYTVSFDVKVSERISTDTGGDGQDNNGQGNNGIDPNSLWYVWVMLGVVTVLGCVTTSICCFCIIGTIFAVSCAILFIFFCGCCSCLIYSSQRKRLRKFKKLNNFDLLLREQFLEEKESSNRDGPRININQDLFEIKFEELKLLDLLGEGGSEAKVYKCSWRNNEIVAFKSFKSRQMCSSQSNFSNFETEANLLGSVSHPNIIRFFGCILKPPRVGFVMEYCQNGDLWMYIQSVRKKRGSLSLNELFLNNFSNENNNNNNNENNNNSNKSSSFRILDEHKYRLRRKEIQKYLEEKKFVIPYSEKLRILMEICSGMSYLHSRKVIHRDLKCENVLLDEHITCKIMDFGISRMMEKTTQIKTKKIGTSYYMAPEVVLGLKYNEKCDIFSFSILSWVIFHELSDPYQGHGGIYLENRVANDPTFRPSFFIDDENEEIKNNNKDNKHGSLERFLISPSLGGGRDHKNNKNIKNNRNKIPEYIRNVIKKCWSHNPKERFSFDYLYNFFSDNYRKEMERINREKEEEENDNNNNNENSKNNNNNNNDNIFFKSIKKIRRSHYFKGNNNNNLRDLKNKLKKNSSLEKVPGKRYSSRIDAFIEMEEVSDEDENKEKDPLLINENESSENELDFHEEDKNEIIRKKEKEVIKEEEKMDDNNLLKIIENLKNENEKLKNILNNTQ